MERQDRYIVQIAFETESEWEEDGYRNVSTLWGLCNDGTMLFFDEKEDMWVKAHAGTKPIPQD